MDDYSQFEQAAPQTPVAPQNYSTSSQPKTYLALSILVTLFCCLPFGIVSIVNAASVSSRWAAGDYDGAARASQQAKTWCTVSLIIGLVWVAVCFVASILGAAFGDL